MVSSAIHLVYRQKNCISYQADGRSVTGVMATDVAQRTHLMTDLSRITIEGLLPVRGSAGKNFYMEMCNRSFISY